MIKNKKIIIAILAAAVIAGIAYFEEFEKIAEEKTGIDLSTVGKLLSKRLPPDAVEIILSKDEFKIGEEIFYAVQNKTDKEIIVENECPNEPLEIYYKEGENWKHLKGEASVDCSASSKEIVIGSYELKGSSYLPWENIIFNKPGRYKIELEIEGYANEYEKEFEIIP